jgi:CheY-like chemotaxis protein
MANILLVDDRDENLVALEAILGSLDQTLVRARSGEEALRAMLTNDFAVILLDIVMPGMDGFEIARAIKRRRKTREVPIIFLTAADAGPDYAFRGYSAGAVDYIAKPFDPWVLRAKVSVFVELYRKNIQLREQAEQLRNQVPTDLREGIQDISGRLSVVEERVGHALALATKGKADDFPEVLDTLRSVEEYVVALRAAVNGVS